MNKSNKVESDIRSMRPIMVKDRTTKQVITLQQTELVQVGDCEVSFAAPNNVSVFVSISKRKLAVSKKLYKEVITDRSKKKKELKLEKKDLSKLYKYLEHIQTTVICTYTAVEALANVAIPNDYKYETKNNKGVMEVWDKESIERWFKTSDKFTKLIPEILKIDSPASKPFWSKFKQLEVVRNEIIHQKTSRKKSTDVDSDYLKALLQKKIFEHIEAAYELISYVCNADISHSYFPLGFGPAKVPVKELDNFQDEFELVREANT
ncbi:hypothetical protein [Vibrio vulnificus]|uniref:hypothetical protein n=1 Tax=Vibrio vulnificus TaxID=672 RepID=UPI0005F24E6B|nr:hypothetical protein [Vibrio vulnificus]